MIPWMVHMFYNRSDWCVHIIRTAKRIAVAHVFNYLLPKVQRLLAKDNSHMQLFATQLV